GLYVEKDWVGVLKILLDATEPSRVRLKAAEMIGDFADTEAIDPLRNTRFGNDIIQKEVDEAVKKIHKRYFTTECPFCAEIIKKKAKICKHCKKELTSA
ncbi:MAG: zinc ribbon domain-containing protein, partial [Deltaproteobacteria bacterium]|nr:zinc ribbon domain-containing protein [Deltaproteobacteria bacterium]